MDLAGRGFYNGVCFHRVIAEFMLQGGCPNTRSDATFTKALAGKGNAPPNSEYTQLVSGERLKRNAEGCIDDECTRTHALPAPWQVGLWAEGAAALSDVSRDSNAMHTLVSPPCP